MEEHMKRRILSVVLAMILACSALSSAFCGPAASAASGTTLSLAPATGTFATGDGDLSVAVSIITAGEVVNAVRAYVKFDPAKLEVVRIDATDSKFPMQWPTTFDNAAGTVDINRTCMGGETFDGTGPVSSIIFRGKVAGTVTVELVLAESMVMRVSDYTNVLAAVGSATYTITVTPPGVKLGKTSVSVAEGGATDTYTIALKNPPTADVIIVASPDTKVKVSPAVLRFTPANWISPQTVTVTAVDDAIAEGAHTGRIAHMVTSTDTGYNAIAVGTVTATVEDNEFALGVTATFGHDTTRILKLIIGKYWMYLDGVAVKLDAAPIIRNSRTLLPVRAIAEVTGSVVSWDARTRKVTVKRKDRMVELWIGKNIARVNGKSMNIDTDDYRVVPIMVNSRTLLPLRFVAESLGLDVQWSDTTRTVTITWKP